ncbi:MAG TPA: hypothetical protein VD866_30855, partial [Urbifossiella sp.]|nr:hypothetical protein [Urbifossiella sp.]
GLVRGAVRVGFRAHVRDDTIGRVTLSPEYRAYLKSDRWQQTRKKAFARHGRRCAVCGTKWRLQVHHLTYERLGHEQTGDFRILCRKHHKKGRYSARAIAADANAVWWLTLLERLTTALWRAAVWCLRAAWRLPRVIVRRHGQ